MQENKRKSRGVFGFLREKGRIWILLCGAVAGIVLILLGDSLGKAEQAAAQPTEQEALSELSAYEERLESELETLCKAVAGVGHPEVMVRLSSGASTVYSKDANGSPITVGSGSNENALCETLCAPEIAGVGIVCRGGSSPAIQQKLIELVSTTLGIPSNRVCVTGK